MEPAVLRPFAESDRISLTERGWPVVESWRSRSSIHLVATQDGVLVGALQAARSPRTAGLCETILRISPGYWRDGAPEALLEAAIRFARLQRADRLGAAYVATEENLGAFLLTNGFVPFERYLPSRLALAAFEPADFSDAGRRIEAQGIRLRTYADIGDTRNHRRRLFDLENAARRVQPFREAGTFVPPSFEEWEGDLPQAHERIFLAEADGEFVGLVTGFDWCFTGVHPQWQGRGIATALKVRSLAAAKEVGVESVETENHEDNAAMLAINRKLGFAPGPVETNCRLSLL